MMHFGRTVTQPSSVIDIRSTTFIFNGSIVEIAVKSTGGDPFFKSCEMGRIHRPTF